MLPCFATFSGAELWDIVVRAHVQIFSLTHSTEIPANVPSRHCCVPCPATDDDSDMDRYTGTLK